MWVIDKLGAIFCYFFLKKGDRENNIKFDIKEKFKDFG